MKLSSDWFMVILTFVYVVATIFICYFNYKSAKSAKEQTEEMKIQYNEENRPIIEVEFHLLHRQFYVIRLINHGRRSAEHVKVKLEKDFIDSLSEELFKNELQKNIERECIIGVDQHYDLFIGRNGFRSNPNKKPITGKVFYSSNGIEYERDIYVDLETYSIFYSTTNDDLVSSIKEQTKELRKISTSLDHIMKKDNSVCRVEDK